MTPTPEEQREHDESVRSLLAIEAAAVEILDDDARALPRSPDAAADELRERLARTLLAARRASRRQAGNRLLAELRIVERRAGSSFGLTLSPGPREGDAAEAERAAKMISELVRRRAIEADVRTAIVRTRRALRASAQLAASDAWGDERERVLRALEREQEDSDVLPLVGRVWDARLDACPVCRKLDGTVRPIGVGFPSGAVAGVVHAACRCHAHVLFAPVALDRSA